LVTFFELTNLVGFFSQIDGLTADIPVVTNTVRNSLVTLERVVAFAADQHSCKWEENIKPLAKFLTKSLASWID
jgi:hypothetical protein